MQDNNFNNNEGSIGIGAMIVFIALILVAAVASAVIIQTGEKLQQNAQQSGDDTQREISGKITINSAFVIDNAGANSAMRLYIESAPGSGVLAASDIVFQITCENAAVYQFLSSTFSNGDAVADANEVYLMSLPNNIGGGGTAILTMDPGQNYMIDIVVGGAAGADCDIGDLGVNGAMTLWIHVQGGGSSYETIYISSTDVGTLLI
jgi:flagellin FlaB